MLRTSALIPSERPREPLLLGMKVLIQIDELRRLDELLRDLGRLERREVERRRVMVLPATTERGILAV